MHYNNLKFYCFIDQFDKIFLDNLSNNISIIYRNYSIKNNIQTIKKIKEYCKKKKIKFFLSNNIKLAMSLNLDGAYIPSFNKDLSFCSYNLKNKFSLLGSAHSIKEIRHKELQKIHTIFLSPIFSNNKKRSNLGIYRFINLSKLTKKKIVCLGGVKKTNLKIIRTLGIYGAASISLFQQ